MSFRSSAKTFPHADGTLQSHLNHPVSLMHPIPDCVSFSLAAMAEPLSVILQATRRARMIVDKFHTIENPVRPTIAIFGAGTIGLLAAALAKSPLYPLQASRIILFDINEARLQYASEHGFVKSSDTYLLPLPNRDLVMSWSTEERVQYARDNINTALEQLDLSQGVDCVYECTGAEPCIQMGIFVSLYPFSPVVLVLKTRQILQAARPGGRVLTIGMGSTTMAIPLLSAATREVDLIGVFRYANTYAEAIELLSKCEQLCRKLEKLVTHR
jgi:L-iditol 2-dehydrogenase